MNCVLTGFSTSCRYSGRMLFGLDDSFDEWRDEWIECGECERLLEGTGWSPLQKDLWDVHCDRLWESKSDFPSDASDEWIQRCPRRCGLARALSRWGTAWLKRLSVCAGALFWRPCDVSHTEDSSATDVARFVITGKLSIALLPWGLEWVVNELTKFLSSKIRWVILSTNASDSSVRLGAQ